jgi:DHA1 family tetracycline resistance protein-like MFS transporter
LSEARGDADRFASPVARLPVAVRWLVATAFAVAVGYGLVAPVLPVFARSFGVSITATSAVIGSFAVVRIAFAPLSGRVVGRLGELPALCAGLVIVAASSVACAFAVSYGQLLAFRALGGAGSTLFTVSSDLMLIRVSSRALLGRASAAWAGGFLFGSVAGPVIGAVLSVWGLRVPFLVYGGVLLVTAATSVAGLGAWRAPSLPGGRSTWLSLTFRGAWRSRTFRAAAAGNFVDGWTVQGVRTVLVPIVVTETFARGPAWSGLALTAFAAGSAAGLPFGGRLADRRSRRLPALLGSAMLAMAAVGLGMSSSLAEFFVVSLLSGIGTGLLTPPLNAAVGDLISAGPAGGGGSAMAGYQMIGDLGAVLGPLLVGVVADLDGYVVAFGTGAVVAGVCFGAWLCVGGEAES